jgi:hypothetical protein
MAGVDVTLLLKRILIGLFLLGFVILLGGFNASKPRILVLHSYHQGTPWTHDLNLGVQQALNDNRRPVSVQWHYLNVGFDEADDALPPGAVIEAHRTIARIDPDILIAFDDESNAHVARHYAGRTRPKVVFGSIVQSPQQYGYVGSANVSGLPETLPLAAVRNTLLVVRPNQPTRIAVIGVDDDTGRAELAQVQAFDWTPHRLAAVEISNSFTDWQAFIKRMADHADALLVLSCGGMKRGDGNAQFVTIAEIADWIETNAQPLPLGIRDVYVQNGGGLSFSPPPFDYGQKTMELALAWIDASSGAAAPPVITSAHFHVGLRPARLAIRGIELPAIYVEAARIGGNYFP